MKHFHGRRLDDTGAELVLAALGNDPARAGKDARLAEVMGDHRLVLAIGRAEEPEHEKERHHGGDEVGIGDFPGAAVMTAAMLQPAFFCDDPRLVVLAMLRFFGFAGFRCCGHVGLLLLAAAGVFKLLGAGPLGAKNSAPGMFDGDNRRRAVQIGEDAGLDALEILTFFDEQEFHFLNRAAGTWRSRPRYR